MDFGNLKILMISSDKNILSPESAVSLRMKEYAALIGELHIVLLTKGKDNFIETKLTDNLWVYPTNSISRWFYPTDASKVGKRIVYEKNFVRGKSLITTQDPFECGWIGLSIKNKWRIPLEVQLHTDPFSNQFYGALNSIRKVLAKRVLKNADHFRVVTHTLAQKINEVYGVDATKISVLPIYVDKERITKGELAFDLHGKYSWHFILLTVARLTPEKNLSFALEILKKIHTRFPLAGLVIVGSGPMEETLKKQAKKMGLDTRVAFEGWQEKLYSYYQTSNAYLQTSKFEGYGLSLIEAGLSGLPIVTTPVGIAQELENGKDLFICREGDIESFAGAIYEIIENNRTRENLKLHIKETLNNTLLSKDEYLKILRENWLVVSQSIT